MLRARIDYWAEGPTDRAAARKLIRHVGGEPGTDYSGRRTAAPGKDYLDRRLSSFNAAAKFTPWLILRDTDGECAALLANRLLPEPARNMCLRLVVPAIEAWLLADGEAIADILGISPSQVPMEPEMVGDVKACLLRLASRSRLRSVRSDFLPVGNSGRREGMAYATSLIEFIENTWSPKSAAMRSPSLQRAIDRIAAILGSRV